jgi:hypothetical protein
LSVPAALAAVFFLALAAGLAQGREGSSELAALVPRVDAWTQSEAPRSFFPESLFEYIDGAAESYLSYDFRELLVVDLEKKGTEATLTLEIYDMGSPVNAFGIFGAERYPENRAVSIGELGYLEGEALNFMTGRFYVKMLGFGLGEETGSVLAGVGAQVAAAVKVKGSLPAFVLAFPKENLVAQSEKYIKKNFMGYEFLRHGFVATYKVRGILRRGGIRQGRRRHAREAHRCPGRGQKNSREDRPRLSLPKPLRPASLHRPRPERPLRRDARPRRPGSGGRFAPRSPEGRPGQAAVLEMMAG